MSATITAATFDSFGILEHILSFVEIRELLAATQVNRRFKLAGRSHDLWKAACIQCWKDRKGITELGDDMPLFWRSSWSDEVIASMSVRQIRSLFDHFLLHEHKARLKNCLEKSEMLALVASFRDTVVNARVRFTDLWFGAYASSIIDSRRSIITKEELCSPFGFNVFFKILQDEVWDEADMAELRPYEGHDGVLLFHHSVSYFKPNGDFEMEMKDPESVYPIDLRWRWAGNMVQVGPYPHLVVTRQEHDWGWKLENIHVIMLFRGSKANYGARGGASEQRSS